MSLAGAVEKVWYGPAGEGAPLRSLLTPPALGLRLGVGVRNSLYAAGLLPVKRPPVPCISVGNLVVGGTGKTPVTAWISRFLQEASLFPAVISRGYGGSRTGPEVVVPGSGAARLYGDEPVMLARAQPDLPVVIGRDRWAAGKKAAHACGAKVLVADDAFQHRRLHRDLEIVVIDAGRLFGNGRLFPRGPLREPAAALARADVLLLTRVSEAGSALAERKALLATLAPGADFVESDIVPSRWRRFGAGAEDSPAPGEGGVFAFSGIANPDSFTATLERAGCPLRGKRVFRDHHFYADHELEALAEAAAVSGAAAAVTTAKDAVRIDHWPGKVPLLVLDVTIRFLAGEGPFREKIIAAAEGGGS